MLKIRNAALRGSIAAQPTLPHHVDPHALHFATTAGCYPPPAWQDQRIIAKISAAWLVRMLEIRVLKIS